MRLDSELVERVRRGDREALAQFLLRHEDLIRARFRDGLSSAGPRLNDTSDFVATIARRFFGVFTSTVTARLADADTLGRTLHRIMVEAAVDHARAERADRGHASLATLRADEPTAAGAPVDRDQPLFGDGTDELAPVDRQILRLRAEGSPHKTIADALGMSVAAVRMRWSRLTGKLRGKSEPRGE